MSPREGVCEYGPYPPQYSYSNTTEQSILVRVQRAPNVQVVRGAYSLRDAHLVFPGGGLSDVVGVHRLGDDAEPRQRPPRPLIDQ